MQNIANSIKQRAENVGIFLFIQTPLHKNMPSVRLYITYSVYTTKLFLTRFFFWIFAYDKDVVIKFVWWYNYQGL